MEKIVSRILNCFVIIGIILTLGVLVLTPLVLTASLKHDIDFMEQYPYAVEALTAGIYVCAIPYIYALTKFKRICKHFAKGEIFVTEIAKNFLDIAKSTFLEIVLGFVALIISCHVFEVDLSALIIFPTFIAIFVGITIGLFSVVMAFIFQKICAIKEENELVF